MTARSQHCAENAEEETRGTRTNGSDLATDRGHEGRHDLGRDPKNTTSMAASARETRKTTWMSPSVGTTLLQTSVAEAPDLAVGRVHNDSRHLGCDLRNTTSMTASACWM
mmetsp:Transcript_85145/g.124580  ORF Transcript_85145/g.124580 Transcript_85145/m.124580 type:complete len:110 (-) Transcript_85145:60-389(-)